ncbi:MAG: HAMP domain-containing histidine kinase [Clostridiaceae bacterium]|nr:HAMP domain-containing histidine kinase [Clostridiaceae bacterium]
MLSPSVVWESEEDEFSIKVIFNDFIVEGYENKIIEILPIPLIDLYDYRLYGNISENGEFKLTFEEQVIKGTHNEEINISTFIPKYGCVGKVQIDIRVFDRDPESIQQIINRGIQDNNKESSLGKNDTKNLLNSMSGIGIYRGKFRIRPYGDPGYDWLELDRARVQTPAKRIGSNQVIGFVEIEEEEKSHLEEKSARDGLKEDVYFETLKSILKQAIHELEIRRYKIRKLVGRGRSNIGLQKELNSLFDFEKLSDSIEKVLTSNVEKDKIVKIKEYIDKTEKEKAIQLEKIENTIAIYQGQATLGKIVKVVLHEGRKPLSWFKNQAGVMKNLIDKISKDPSDELISKVKERSLTSKEQAEKLNKLFNRLTPLASNRKNKAKVFNIKKVISDSYEVFQEEIDGNNIKFNLFCDDKAEFNGWEEDFYIIFTNLIENSIYWLKKADADDKYIAIDVRYKDKLNYIDIKDNGVGIRKDFIESKIIFEPDFSTKNNNEGSGLGLALAGEASDRNNCNLQAIYCDDGARFRLEAMEMEE